MAKRPTTGTFRDGPIIVDPSQRQACERLRARLRAAEAERLRDLVVMHQRHAAAAQRGHAASDGDLARLLATLLVAALDRYPELDPARQEWLRIAVHYFASSDDARHDFVELGGLHDDALLVAAVLEHCGRADDARAIREHLA